MNKEEKEAIKYLEFLSNEKCECEACQRAKKKYKTILNLLEKQQKLINIFISNEAVREEKDFNEIKEKYYECL